MPETTDDDSEPASTCEHGVAGVQSGSYCCTVGCETCGGSGCSARGFNLTREDCCTTDIEVAGVLCSESETAPCIIGESLINRIVRVCWCQICLLQVFSSRFLGQASAEIIDFSTCLSSRPSIYNLYYYSTVVHTQRRDILLCFVAYLTLSWRLDELHF